MSNADPTNEVKAARQRVSAFIAGRDRHRAGIDKVQAMMGKRPSNPVPNLIIAEYGVLDIEDLRLLVEFTGKP